MDPFEVVDRTESYGGDTPPGDPLCASNGECAWTVPPPWTGAEVALNAGVKTDYVSETTYRYGGVAKVESRDCDNQPFVLQSVADVAKGSGQPLSMTDASGLTTFYDCDALGRVITVTPPAQMTPVTYGFFSRTGGAPANKLTITRSGGAGSEFLFDDLGRITSKKQDTAAGQAVTMYAYTATGKLSTETLPAGQPRVITHQYDVLEREIKRIGADSKETEFIYFGERGSQTRTHGVSAPNSTTITANLSTGLDSFGRLRLANDDILRAVYEFDVLSNLTTATLNKAGGGGGTQKREFAYDGRGVMTSETNPELHDAQGQVKIKYTADSRGHVLSRRYVWEGGTPSAGLDLSAFDLQNVTTGPKGSPGCGAREAPGRDWNCFRSRSISITTTRPQPPASAISCRAWSGTITSTI